MMGRIVFADALRGIAALSVLLAHYGLAFWKPGPTIGEIANVPSVPPGVMPELSHQVLYAPPMTFSLAAFGVGLFFLISGFVIPLSIDRLDSVSFLHARAWRLGPTYAAGFLFTVAALAVASHVYGKPFPYSRYEIIAHSVPGLRAFLGTRYIDYVVWTLEIELAFYALSAAMSPWLRRGALVTFSAPVIVVLVLLTLPLPDIYRVYGQSLACMFVGVAFSFHHTGKLGSAAALALGIAVFSFSLWVVNFFSGFIYAASYAVATAVFCISYLARSSFPNLAPLRGLAAISYPLYVVHGIMGYVAMRIMLDHGIAPGLTVILALGLAVAVSTAFHFGVEVPTQRIGKRLARPASPAA